MYLFLCVLQTCSFQCCTKCFIHHKYDFFHYDFCCHTRTKSFAAISPKKKKKYCTKITLKIPVLIIFIFFYTHFNYFVFHAYVLKPLLIALWTQQTTNEGLNCSYNQATKQPLTPALNQQLNDKHC